MRRKSFEWNSWYVICIHKNFSIEEFFWKMKGSPTKFFGTVEKIIVRQNRDTLSYAIFLIQKFSVKKVPLGISSVLWDEKVSREKRDITFLAIKFFDNKNFWKKKGSRTKLFGTVRKSVFDIDVIHHLMQFF